MGSPDAHVVIDDAQENNWLTATMFNSPHYQSLPGYEAIDHLWIGLYQDPQGAEPAGGWTWVDGSPVTYSNWGINEPSDGHPLSGECQGSGKTSQSDRVQNQPL